MEELDNISKEDVLYDLKRAFTHAKQVYEGLINSNVLSKEGAFRRMQVYMYAINNLS